MIRFDLGSRIARRAYDLGGKLERVRPLRVMRAAQRLGTPNLRRGARIFMDPGLPPGIGGIAFRAPKHLGAGALNVPQWKAASGPARAPRGLNLVGVGPRRRWWRRLTSAGLAHELGHLATTGWRPVRRGRRLNAKLLPVGRKRKKAFRRALLREERRATRLGGQYYRAAGGNRLLYGAQMLPSYMSYVMKRG